MIRLSPKKYFFVLGVFLCFTYFSVMFFYHETAINREQNRVQQYATSVAGSVWNVNHREAREYLSVVCNLRNYSKLIVKEETGEEFITINNRFTANLFTRFIKPLTIETEIVFEGKNIGYLNVVWHSDTGAVAAIALLVTSLICTSFWFFLHTVANKQNLEVLVNERTDQLNKNIAELIKAEKDLTENRNFLDSVIENIPNMIFVKDANELRFVRFNKAGEELLGYSRKILIGKSDYDFFSKEEADFFTRKDKEVLAKKELLDIPEESILTKNKGQRILHTKKIPILDENGEPLYLLGISEDITENKHAEAERKKLEDQLSQSHKMEAIGSLAGGIAHDFNNILSPIFGYLELAMLGTRADSELTKKLSEILKAAERARQMVKQILTFSRCDSEELLPTQVHVIVKEALKLLRASIPTTIEIRQVIDPNCGTVLANSTQIHQILMNLCTNAYHAMQKTGGLMSVSLIPLDISVKDFTKNINLRPGPYLRLEVSDTGHGMGKEIMDRIFEPYFSTKDKGKGTGMGLSVVHGIVKSIGGHITVYSERGKGSSFHVYLPVHESSFVQTDVLYEGPAPTGTERIMLVDDEETVRNMEKDMLIGLGYKVSAFSSPLEALEQFTVLPDTFDLLITDMTMPKMTGDKLAKKIMEIQPDMPVILCTGFSDLINEDSAKALGIKAYVSKPVTLQSFSRTIRNVLDGVENEHS